MEGVIGFVPWAGGTVNADGTTAVFVGGKVARVGVGTYQVTLDRPFTHGLGVILSTVDVVPGVGTARFVTHQHVTDSLIEVDTFNAAGAAVDGAFDILFARLGGSGA